MILKKSKSIFGQLYKDIKVHGTAEQVSTRQFVRITNTRKYTQTDEVMQVEEISLTPSSSEFSKKVEQLRTAGANSHKSRRERYIPKIRENFSPSSKKQMATDFKTVKSKLQDEMAASTRVAAS